MRLEEKGVRYKPQNSPTTIHHYHEKAFKIRKFGPGINNIDNNNHQPYHHVTLSAQIFLTLSRHSSQSSIAFGRSSGLHLVSASER